MNKLLTLIGTKRLFEFRFITTRITADGKDVPKKKEYENRITLIGIDNAVSISNLKDAQNISTRRELKLVKIQDADSKTRRPVYKLMSKAQYHEEEITRRKEKQQESNSNVLKGQKLMTISSRIADHDIMTNVKKMAKLLEKQYEVKVVISGNENEDEKLERISTIIEKNLKSTGKLVQKRNKGTSLRFQLVPTRDASQSSNDSNNSQGDKDTRPL